MILIIFLALAAVSTVVSQCVQTPVDEVSYFPHETDPAKFWQCLNGAKTLKHCPEYHHFDRVAQSCKNLDDFQNLRESSVCSAGTNGFFPHPTDCSKYIFCLDGTAYVMDCEEGLWFSPSEKICTDPVTAGCETTSLPPWSTPDGSICEDVPDGDIVLKKCDCGCLYYWECKGKKQTLKECEFKLVFVEERQLCAGLIYCNDNTRTPFPWTSTFPTTIVTRPDYEDPRCSGLDDVYFPLPDCTKFTHCEIGWGRIWNCPAGLYFNAEELKCGPYSESSCGDFSTLSLPSTTNTSPYTGDPRCESVDTTGLFPDPFDCSKFIECYQGNSYHMSCPGDLWFSFEQQLCVDESESDCFDTHTTTVAVPTDDQRCRNLDGTFLPHHQDCQKFVECLEGESFERTCPSGFYFDQETGSCTSSKPLNCV